MPLTKEELELCRQALLNSAVRVSEAQKILDLIAKLESLINE